MQIKSLILKVFKKSPIGNSQSIKTKAQQENSRSHH
jgi:hypothetical protein